MLAGKKQALNSAETRKSDGKQAKNGSGTEKSAWNGNGGGDGDGGKKGGIGVRWKSNGPSKNEGEKGTKK